MPDETNETPLQVEKPITGPPRRAENLFAATVTYANGATKETALDIAGSRRPMTEAQARDYFERRLGPAGHVARVENVRRVTRAEIGPTPGIPTIAGGRQVGAVPVAAAKPKSAPAASPPPANG